MLVRLAAAAALSLTLASTAAADPLSEAQAAFESRDFAAAGRLARPLADAGDPEALYIVGEALARTGETANHVLGLEPYLRAAALGQRDAQWRLALIYGDPASGDLADDRKALTWLLRAVAQGSMNAAATLADAYDRGTLGLARNEELTYYYRRLYLRLLAVWVRENDRPDAPVALRTAITANKRAIDVLSATYEAQALRLHAETRRRVRASVETFEVVKERP